MSSYLQIDDTTTGTGSKLNTQGSPFVVTYHSDGRIDMDTVVLENTGCVVQGMEWHGNQVFDPHPPSAT